MESHPYMIEAEYFTEIMLIVNSAEVGLAVEIEYKAGGLIEACKRQKFAFQSHRTL
jgi:hypothetical protein